MAGRGPAPKDPRRRARRNADGVPTTVIAFTKGTQPPLPELDGTDWPDRTREWWAMWGETPLADHFMDIDWQFLLDTALLHAAVWGAGDFSKLPELRIRVAKYGATPEDRARLRIQFADADAADGGSPTRARPAVERLGRLVSFPGGAANVVPDPVRKPRSTPAERKKVTAAYRKGATIPELAEQFGRAPATLRAWLVAAGVKLRDDRKPRPPAKTPPAKKLAPKTSAAPAKKASPAKKAAPAKGSAAKRAPRRSRPKREA